MPPASRPSGNHTQAVRAYQEALRHEPDHPVALVNLGLELESLGREAEAEAAYLQAVEARPREALPHFNLGNARFRRGDLQSAVAAYRAAVEADPGLARAHFYLAVALINTGNPEEALRPSTTPPSSPRTTTRSGKSCSKWRPRFECPVRVRLPLP